VNPVRLRVDVAEAPEPGLVRPAIEARLRGAAWPTGPEAVIAEAVAEAAAAATATTTPGMEATE
jgi:hypothetical protein